MGHSLPSMQGPGAKPAAEGPSTEANSSGSTEAQVSHVLDTNDRDDGSFGSNHDLPSGDNCCAMRPSFS